MSYTGLVENVGQTWLDPPEWMEQAACAGMPMEMFFLGDSEGKSHNNHGKPETLLIGLGVCAHCPVKDDCAEEAIADPKLDYGIRGGLTSDQRRAIRRRRR